MPGTKTISMGPSPMVWYAILTSPLTAYRVVGNTKSLIGPRPACAILAVRSEKWRQSTLSTNWFAKPRLDHPRSSLSWDWSREHSKIMDWSLDPMSVLGLINRPDGPEIRLPLFPRKRTQVGHRAMSGCHEETSPLLCPWVDRVA